MEHLKEWIEQVLNDNGCSLYELEWLKEEATPILRVSIEKKVVLSIWIRARSVQTRSVPCSMKKIGTTTSICSKSARQGRSANSKTTIRSKPKKTATYL